MEDYTTWSADKLRRMHLALRYSSMLREGDVPVEAQYYAIQAELDRRSNEVFEWVDDLLHVKPENPFVMVHQTIEVSDNGGLFPIGARTCIVSYPISNPAEFSALLSYFLTKPRT